MITRVKDKYDLTMANKGFLISSINDYTVHFSMKVLACKMLHKMRPNQCTMGAVALVELCAEGVHINWSQLLLNKLLEDTSMSQENDKTFRYSWLLVLILFVV